MKKAIEVKNLIKSYGNNFQLGKINLEIPSGLIVGLIGENGAGKTTLLKSILNIIKYNGEIKIFDKDSQKEESIIKEDIGVVLDDMFFPEILTPSDISSIMQGVYKNWDKDLFFKYLKDFHLEPNKSYKTFSKGMKKKLEIATSLAHHPKLLILDEPTSGLDPIVRGEVLDIFLNFIQDEEHTILLSTHITSDLEHLADRIVFLDAGQIIFDKSRDELLDNYGILKCSEEDFSKIDKNDIISYKKSKYAYEVLITNKNKISKKYKDLVVDKITIDELMVLMIKGEK